MPEPAKSFPLVPLVELEMLILLTGLRDSNDVEALHDGRDGVLLNDGRLVVLSELEVLHDDGVETGIFELCLR